MTATVGRNIRLLTWFNFLQDFRLYAPVMIIYFERVTGSYALAMSVFGATMLAGAVLEVPTGVFSDLIGRRWTAILGALASLAAVTCYAVGGTYAVLLIGALFEGLERALVSGNNEALLYDTLSEQDRRADFQLYLGRTASAFQLALMTSALAGSLAVAVSFALVMWLSVVPKVLMVGVAWAFIEPTVYSELSGNAFGHMAAAIRQFLRNPRLRLLTIGNWLDLGVNEALFQFRVVFIELLWPVWAIGVARAISNAFATVSFYFAGNAIQRFGERRLLYGGILFSEAMNMLGYVWASVVSPVIMGSTSIFFGVNSVAKSGMVQREFSDAQRATMGSLSALGGSVAIALLSVVVGALADSIGVQTTMIVVTLAGLVRLIFYGLAFAPRHDVPAAMSDDV